jgi:hypothetical protein
LILCFELVPKYQPRCLSWRGFWVKGGKINISLLIAVRGVLSTVHRALIGKGMIYSPSHGDNAFSAAVRRVSQAPTRSGLNLNSQTPIATTSQNLKNHRKIEL